VGIIHDYIFENAQKLCESHQGLHYVVVKNTIVSERSQGNIGFPDYPCQEIFYFRCQDQTIIPFENGIGYCFIPESQLKETLENK